MNPTQIYKEAIAQPDGEKTAEQLQQEANDIRAKQSAADNAQRNMEAWAQWRSNPQTQVFIKTLQSYMNGRALSTAHLSSNVPQMLEVQIRCALAEVSLLNRILTEAVTVGKLELPQ